jgi:mannose-6-phosphate isomerase-like protein (cupin superfamily)
MQKVSNYEPLSHYVWGGNCESWILVDSKSLSVKQELMPPQTGEVLHCHEKAQQFFFILKGIAIFEVEEQGFTLRAGQGLHIEAGKKHRIMNNTGEDLEFLLISQPSTSNDRFNCI